MSLVVERSAEISAFSRTDADGQSFQTEEHYCPFVETLSFGSDIHVKCNETFLIFNEINVSERDVWIRLIER